MRYTINILTIFPQAFDSVFSQSIIRIAQEKNLLKINFYNLRDYTRNKHRKVDAPSYGGGGGMVMQIEPVYRTLAKVKRDFSSRKLYVILLSPQGKPLTQSLARRLLRHKNLVLICGHYEGIDERVRKYLVDEEVSIGDYILSGGEIAAMVLVDVLARLIPGVVGKKSSVENESFEKGLLDWPHYTRPQRFKNWRVPQVLLSGNHKKISEWRKRQALGKTKRLRKDLLRT